MQATNEWWRGTAQHMWRAFFSMERHRKDTEKLSDVNRKTYDACNYVYQRKFTEEDREILRMFFSPHRNSDYPIEEYAKEHNMSVNAVWIVIKRANRLVMETVGLLEKRVGEGDERAVFQRDSPDA